MMFSRFVKFPHYGNGVLQRCKNFIYLDRSASKYPYTRASVLRNNIEAIATRLFDEEKNSTSKLDASFSVQAHGEREEVHASFSHLIKDSEDSTISERRSMLYPDSEDEVIVKLMSCTKIDDVFDTINQVDNPNHKHLVQTVIVLRDLQTSDDFYHDPIIHLINHTLFPKLVEQIVNSVPHMNVDELSISMMYLGRFNVDRNTMLTLISAYEDKIKQLHPSSVTLINLSRFINTVEKFANIWSTYTMINFLPLVIEKLDSVKDYEEHRALSIIFQRMRNILSSDVIKKYLETCSILIPKIEDISAEKKRLIAVLQCVRFLNQEPRNPDYSEICFDLLLSIHGHAHLLSRDHIYSLHSIIFNLQEHRQILQEVKSLVEEELPHVSADSGVDLRSAALFYSHGATRQRHRSLCIHSLKKYLESVNISHDFQWSYVSFLLKAMYERMPYDLELCNKSWDQLAASIQVKNYGGRGLTILDVCMKYLMFYHKRNYRNNNFEEIAASTLNHLAKEKFLLNPYECCLTELLSLFFNFDSDQLEATHEYFVENVSRFEPRQYPLLSLVLEGIKTRLHKSKYSSEYLHYYVQMVSSLNNGLLEYLKNEKNLKRKVHPLYLYRYYFFGGGTEFTELYRLIVNSAKDMSTSDLSARKILSLLSMANCSRTFESGIVEKMVQYMIYRKNVVTSFSLLQLLRYTFFFGYTPDNCDEFVDAASQITASEKEEISGSFLISAALALCYYNCFPRQLSDYIFSINFLESIDQDTTLLTDRRRSTLHRDFEALNRAVCLEYPAYDLPWFHENYSKERISLRSKRKSELQRELSKVLQVLINNDKALQTDCYSPYYHSIDFVLNTNRKGEPVDPNACSAKDLRKTAILLNPYASSTYYLGKGPMEVNIRQLEILNYNVVVINGHLWNSTHMAEPEAKENYLCNLIWPKKSV